MGLENSVVEKKRFAFIEMETHSVLLEQWYLLLKEMNQIEFEFFVHEKVLHKLSSIPKEMITVVKSVLEIPVHHFDAVVVNTFHRNFEQYKAVFDQKPTLCLLHNLNFSLFFKGISLRNVLSEKERLTYFLKLYLKEKVGSNRKLILKAGRFGVLSKSLQDEVAGKSRYADRTQLVQMNYCQSSTFQPSDTINIVMPGNVSNKRKDVTMLLSVLPKLHPKSKLHFTFLGKPENDTVLGQLESLQKQCNENIEITHYNQFIPWEEYSQTVAKAHLLLCPIKSQTSFYWVDEIYGKTKVSGSEGDCIYNGKIGLFPTSYPKMNWHNLYYETASDLETILNNLTIEQLSSEYENLQPYLEQYTFESVKNNLENQLLQLANS
ncbi:MULTISPECIES: hypothetical protein [Flavobacterium]|uniref:hypothetical protein n=1 Tax=Flavobacterium TaxID=237 RepID=UPI001FCA5E25|nr:MULTISPECIES: hypothetical protein [Flavobacterium]UOK43639.1 hypothetical protein LZF87_05850 [Flavobacterium enshiense]